MAPKTWYVFTDRLNTEHFFMNDPTTKMYPTNMSAKSISTLSRFYNTYKKIPYKDTTKVIHTIFPYIEIQHHQEYIDLLPYRLIVFLSSLATN